MSDFPKHTGGGWMETSDGERFHSREEAEEHQAKIDAPPAATVRDRKQARARAKAAANRRSQEAAEPVDLVEVKVTANPRRWGRGEWVVPGINQRIGFDQDGEAWVTVERNGERIGVSFNGPSGESFVEVSDLVARHKDFVVTDETRTREVPA